MSTDIAVQRTLIFLKPDVYEKRIIGKVIEDIQENDGHKIIAMKMFRLTKRSAENFYAVHRGKKFYDDLVSYVSRGPIIAIVLEGTNIISEMRDLMGATNPTEAAPDTLRGKYGSSLDNNVLHGSDSEKSAATEIPFFFSGYDL